MKFREDPNAVISNTWNVIVDISDGNIVQPKPDLTK